MLHIGCVQACNTLPWETWHGQILRLSKMAMTVAEIKSLLLISAGLNYAILIIWFAAFLRFHDGLLRLHRRWFALSAEAFDAIHYAAMSLYKIGILLLNVAPLVAMLVLSK